MSPTDALKLVQRHLEESAEAKRRTAQVCGETIVGAAELLVRSYQAGGKVLFCGNGGSAADCQHLAAELMSALDHDRPRRALGAIALTTDTSFLTGNANDFGFEHVFERQVEALGRPGDVLVAISTSGESPNVVRALRAARASGMTTIVLSGRDGGEAATHADLEIRIPCDETQLIQECHISVGHLLCELVERELFPR
jgi:D-sedoheptulose 7-phosphate isomerase